MKPVDDVLKMSPEEYSAYFKTLTPKELEELKNRVMFQWIEEQAKMRMPRVAVTAFLLGAIAVLLVQYVIVK